MRTQNIETELLSTNQLKVLSTLSITRDKLLVLLDEAPTHTTTESGIMIPQFQATDNPTKPQVSTRKHLFKGTVIKLSPVAKKRFEEWLTPLKEGDKVYISPSAYQEHTQFFLERDGIALPFQGILILSPEQIEAIIHD